MRFGLVLIAVALAAAPTASHAFQSGTETFAASGIMDGQQYVAITVNHDTQAVTFHHADGTQFTQANVHPGIFAALLDSLRRRQQEASGN